MWLNILGGFLLAVGIPIALGAILQASRQTAAVDDLPDSIRQAEQSTKVAAWIGVAFFLAIPILGLLLLLGVLP